MHNYYSKIKSIKNNSNQSVISKDFHGIDPLTETYKNNYNLYLNKNSNNNKLNIMMQMYVFVVSQKLFRMTIVCNAEKNKSEKINK